MNGLLDNQTQELPSGYKTVAALTTAGLTVNGEVPTEGWVKLDKGQVVDYSLKFGEYVVNYDKTTNSSVSTKNGEIGPMPEAKVYRTIDNELTKINKSEMQSGDTVILKFGDIEEQFIVLTDSTHVDSLAPAGTTMLLAVNNLNVGNYKNTSLPEGYQGTNGVNYYVAFSQINYWSSYSDVSNIYDSENYSGNPGTNTYSIAYYVNMYVQNLQNLGFTGVNSGRILTFAEAHEGIAVSYSTSGENYWLGSAASIYGVWTVDTGNGFISRNYANVTYDGVRPVIYISTYDIQ